MGSIDNAFLTGFVCRLCSKVERNVIHIYGEKGRKMGLRTIIKKYLSISVSIPHATAEIRDTKLPPAVLKIRPLFTRPWKKYTTRASSKSLVQSSENPASTHTPLRSTIQLLQSVPKVRLKFPSKVLYKSNRQFSISEDSRLTSP